MKAHRLAGVVSVMVLVLSLGVECLAGPPLARAQMPCCSGGAHDCGAALTSANCCRSERAEPAQVSKPPSPPAAATACVSAMAALVRPEDARPQFDIDGIPPNGSSPPKYILLATFLI
jgi:hypothetical protein